jgi:hypothetical protein
MECSRPAPVVAAFRFPSEPGTGSRKPNAGMGWPLGLRSCVVAQTTSPSLESTVTAARTWLRAPQVEEEEEALAQRNNMGFHFASFSDLSVSSDSDSDFHSEAASSSFFKDSRRITLGSLIGLHMESTSGRAGMHLETGYNNNRRIRQNRRSFGSFAMANNYTCGIRELLGCANCMQLILEENLSEGFTHPAEPIALTQSHAGCLEMERHVVVLEAGGNQAATSGGSRTSLEWSAGQFVSCNNVLSDAQESLERYNIDQAHDATPFSSSTTISTSTRTSSATSRIQRSVSMKSFLSTICCHVHSHHL